MEKRINALETELKKKTEQLDYRTKECEEQRELVLQLQEQVLRDDMNTTRNLDAYNLHVCNIFNINGNVCYFFYVIKCSVLIYLFFFRLFRSITRKCLRFVTKSQDNH